jgi:dihydropteroate synthase
MTKKPHILRLNKRDIVFGDRTWIMGILNVTPDSFSDGGKYLDPDRAYARAVELEDQGADIIDIGAESTRPGSTRVSEAEELRRLIPVLKRLRDKLGVPLCVDTYKSAVAEKAIEFGADIINDPSGLTFDPSMAKVVAQHNTGLILNHMRGTPETWGKLPPVPDVMLMVLTDLEATVHRAMKAGVEKTRIVVDPGLGFGKRKEQNSEILARLPELARLGVPVMVGPSRKSFLARPTERETSFANASAVAAAVFGGAQIIRVHEVPEMRVAASVADAIVAAVRDDPRTSGERDQR